VLYAQRDGSIVDVVSRSEEHSAKSVDDIVAFPITKSYPLLGHSGGIATSSYMTPVSARRAAFRTSITVNETSANIALDRLHI
jgi:hypothetical protein